MKNRALAPAAMTVEDLFCSFSARGIRRAYVVDTPAGLVASHPAELAPVVELMRGSPDFAGHEAVFIGRDDAFPTLFFAFVHDTHRGLAQGGLRFAAYGSALDLVRDGLRLSRGMTRKNALAGLWWGGGKGILARTADLDARPELLAPSPDRDRLFEAYGAFIASLGGIYYTAEDFGTTTRDMNSILRSNRFVTCIAPELGGSGNPSELTARGVLQSIKASWQHLAGTGSLEGVQVALQGVGNVGGRLARLLAAEGARLTIADPFREAAAKIVAEIPGTRVVEGDAIFDADADILAPCARGAQINPDTLPRLKVKLVCGAANNILDDPARDAKALEDRGILFVPDYVANRMGIVNCADEWRGKQLPADLDAAIDGVYRDTAELLQLAAASGQTTTAAAEAWADEKARHENPLFGHRGKGLIDRLTAGDWAIPGR